MANTLRYSNTVPGKIYYQNNTVKNVYYNGTKVWSSGPPVTGDLVIGNTVTFDNKQWIVVHNDGDKYYLALSMIYSRPSITSGDSKYEGSQLASIAGTYQTTQMSASALSYCLNVTTENVTAKVFVPTYTQVNGGFSYYNSNSNRIAKWQGSSVYAYNWWTSTTDDASAWYVVDSSGSIQKHYSNKTYDIGFRPHICVQG